MKRSIVALYRHRMSLLFTTVLVVLASRAYSLVGDLPRGAKDAILVLSLVAGLLCLILSFGGPGCTPRGRRSWWCPRSGDAGWG